MGSRGNFDAFCYGPIVFALAAGILTMLYQVPPPSAEDIANRTERKPMNHVERAKVCADVFLWRFCLVFGYLCLMAYRDLRDSFMDLILTDLGHEVDSSTFAGIEAKVGFMSLVE